MIFGCDQTASFSKTAGPQYPRSMTPLPPGCVAGHSARGPPADAALPQRGGRVAGTAGVGGGGGRASRTRLAEAVARAALADEQRAARWAVAAAQGRAAVLVEEGRGRCAWNPVTCVAVPPGWGHAAAPCRRAAGRRSVWSCRGFCLGLNPVMVGSRPPPDTKGRGLGPPLKERFF